MTIARSHQIDLSATPFYHCYTRCVRRSYLCGNDPLSGRDFSHRRGWIVERMKQLASVFAIQICAYAVMSNHYHVVLHVHSEQAQQWTTQEVTQRWQALYPKDTQQWLNAPTAQLEPRIALWRERLMSVSWFMRCLNELIACKANKEDGCTGSFWEGRFKSQALLDEGAILSAMAYVDLNPIHAHIADTPENADFTSIQERIRHLKQQQLHTQADINLSVQPSSLMSLKAQSSSELGAYIPFNLADYITLVDYTGRIKRDDKKGAIPETLAPILARLHLTSAGWLRMIKGIETDFSYAVGEERMLFAFGLKHHTSPKGRNAARKYYLSAA